MWVINMLELFWDSAMSSLQDYVHALKECLNGLHKADNTVLPRLQQLVFEAMRLRAAHLRVSVTGSNGQRSNSDDPKGVDSKSAADIETTLVEALVIFLLAFATWQSNDLTHACC